MTQFSMCKKYLEDADMNANFEESASKLSDLTSELDRETRLNVGFFSIKIRDVDPNPIRNFDPSIHLIRTPNE